MPSKVPAAASTLRILTYLASRSRPIPASRIAAELEIPRSSTYDILSELLQQGFVIHYQDLHAFGLGPSAYELSFGFSRQAPLARLGKRVTERLTEKLGETSHVAVLQGKHVLYVVEAKAPTRASLLTEAGVRIPAHLTATGRAILGYLPKAQLKTIYHGVSILEPKLGLPASSAFPVARAFADARDTRIRGYAVENSDVVEGIRSVAVPVFDGSRWPIASVAVTWEASDNSRDPVIVEHVRAAADQLQRALA